MFAELNRNHLFPTVKRIVLGQSPRDSAHAPHYGRFIAFRATFLGDMRPKEQSALMYRPPKLMRLKN